MLADTPSRREGMTYEEELSKRQQGGVFIFDIAMQLTHGKGEHGLSGVAATLFNRFFNVHSLKRCDFRDVAAACVFLAGKNEDAPKKLKYVVTQLWQFKYPHNKQFQSEQHFLDQCNVVTLIEDVLLKTISFDINVDLPHQYVLKLMRDVEKGRNVYKDMVKTAYYMATDVLIITDWSVRYSCASIATACVNIAAFFHNINMDDIVPFELSDRWYRLEDQSMTREEVEAMTKEFLDIFSRNPQFHIGSLKKIDPLGKVKIVGMPPQVSSTVTPSGSSSNLKKIDLESYKGRPKPLSNSSDSPSTRPSFLPDVKNQKVVEQELMEQRMKEAAQQKIHRNGHRPSSSSHPLHHHSTSSSASNNSNHQNRSSSGLSAHQHQKPYNEDSRSAKRSMMYEETNSSKKPRIDYKMSFVASSSTTIATMHNDHFSQTTHQQNISTYARGVNEMMLNQVAPPPLMSVSAQPSTYQKMCMEYQRCRNPADSRHTMSSTQQISPPDEPSPPVSQILLPPPPPPPILPPRLDEMEEGELV